MYGEKHIFFSYRSTEAEFALKLAADLKNAGVKLWMDRLDIHPGDDWGRALQSGIDASTAVLTVLSPAYVKSKYCQRELARADGHGYPIIPVLLEAIPNEDWPFEVQRLQYIDFTAWRDEQVYHAQVRVLVNFINERYTLQVEDVPTPEQQYLTSLVADLEAHKLLFHDPSGDTARPKPFSTTDWLLGTDLDLPANLNNALPRDIVPSHNRISLMDIVNVAEHYPRFVLVGGPGTGKTTILEYLVLQAIYDRIENGEDAPLPFLVEMVQWRGAISFVRFLQAMWPFDSDILTEIALGRVALYLDGLDEIGANVDDKINQIRDWLDGPQSPRRVLITCRANAYQQSMMLDLPSMLAAESQPSQISNFIKSTMVENKAEQLTERIFDDLGYLQEVASNPLLLTILMKLSYDSPDGIISRNLGVIVTHLVDELWKRESQRQIVGGITLADLEDNISKLAYTMVNTQNQLGMSYREALKIVRNQRILIAAERAHFLRIEDGTVRFSYELFLAYFSALWLERSGSRLLWLAKLIEQTLVLEKITMCLAGITADPDTVIMAISEEHPELALKCIATSIPVAKTTLEVVICRLVERMSSTQALNPNRSTEIAHLISTIEHQDSLNALVDVVRGARWDLRQTVSDIIQHLESPEPPSLMDIKHDFENNRRESAAIALQEIGHTALPSLLNWLASQDWRLRRAGAWALGVLADFAGTPGLTDALLDEEDRVVAEAIQSLADIRDPAAIPFIIRCFNHNSTHLRMWSAEALKRIGEPVKPYLLDALHNSDDQMRRMVITTLQDFDDEVVITALLEATYDPNTDIRAAALESLSDRRDSAVIRRLHECLTDHSRLSDGIQTISSVADHILRVIGLEQTLSTEYHGTEGSIDSKIYIENDIPMEILTPSPLSGMDTQEMLMNNKSSSGEKANQRLKELLGSTVVDATIEPHILAGLCHKDWGVRVQTVESLKWQPASQSMPALSKALDNDDHRVRLAAIKVLEGMSEPVAKNGLLKALYDPHAQVASEAGQALAKRGKDALSTLQFPLAGYQVLAKGIAIQNLEKIADGTCVPPLIKLLDDPSTHEHFNGKTIGDLTAEALRTITSADDVEPPTEPVTPYLNGRDSHSASSSSQETVTHAPSPSESLADVISDESLSPEVRLLELIESMRYEGWGDREEAAKSLRNLAMELRGKSVPSIVAYLCALMTDENFVVRCAAVEALGWIRDDQAIACLVDGLKDENSVIRVACIRSLCEFGDRRAVELIVAMLADKSETVRETAAQALGYFGDDRAIKSLVRVAQTDQPFIRYAAVEALGQIDDRSVIYPLAIALRDSDKNVRWIAAHALTNLADESVVHILSQSLHDTSRPYWEEKRVCDLLIDALEKVGNPKALEAVENWRTGRQAEV